VFFRESGFQAAFFDSESGTKYYFTFKTFQIWGKKTPEKYKMLVLYHFKKQYVLMWISSLSFLVAMK
jgi:hypothetical protein